MRKIYFSPIQRNGQTYSCMYFPIPILRPIKHDLRSTQAKDLLYSPLRRLGNFGRPHLLPIDTQRIQFFGGASVEGTFLGLSEHLGNWKIKPRAHKLG